MLFIYKIRVTVLSGVGCCVEERIGYNGEMQRSWYLVFRIWNLRECGTQDPLLHGSSGDRVLLMTPNPLRESGRLLSWNHRFRATQLSLFNTPSLSKAKLGKMAM